MRYSLKTKLSLTIALVVLITVALISLMANLFIGNQFKEYILGQQKKTTQEIVNNISQQYDRETSTWNIDFIHNLGMYALNDGYIIKVYNEQNQVIWDAKANNMDLCTEIINNISYRMKMEYPNLNGEFTSEDFPAIQGNDVVGKVNINYFGPYFLSEDDFLFLDSLNKILVGTGIFSLMISILIGFLMSKHLSNPILKTLGGIKRISEGDYKVRIEEETSIKELFELIVSTNHLAGALEAQESLRRQLTSDVSKELRMPLAKVQTHIEALMAGVQEPTTERLQSCYDEITQICKVIKNLEKLAK